MNVLKQILYGDSEKAKSTLNEFRQEFNDIEEPSYSLHQIMFDRDFNQNRS
jgi:hypothetical protein